MELNQRLHFRQSSLHFYSRIQNVSSAATSALQDGVYWGADKRSFGDFEVEVTSTVTSPAFTSRTMTVRHGKVTHRQHPTNQQSLCAGCAGEAPGFNFDPLCFQRKESRQVKHFQFLKWSSGELPEKPQDLSDLIKEVKRSSGGSSNPRTRTTVVHCK